MTNPERPAFIQRQAPLWQPITHKRKRYVLDRDCLYVRADDVKGRLISKLQFKVGLNLCECLGWVKDDSISIYQDQHDDCFLLLIKDNAPGGLMLYSTHNGNTMDLKFTLPDKSIIPPNDSIRVEFKGYSDHGITVNLRSLLNK